MTTLKSLILLLLLLSLSGCAAIDPMKCRAAVDAKFPGADIQPLPGKQFEFLVRTKTGEVWIVTTLNWTDAEVDNMLRIFDAPKP